MAISLFRRGNTDTAVGRTGTFSNITWQAFAQTMV